MALAIHAPYDQHPVPSFSRGSTRLSLGGSQLSQSSSTSLEAPQSQATTPLATPPSKGSQQRQSFNMGSYGQSNGMHMQQNGSRPYPELNGNAPQVAYPPGHKPQIYTAVYSSVSVYEMEVNGVAVMRRRADSWLNATQILKVAGIDKGKRTKVLEKEILAGEHEKVQGGYGKYQGTWINYRRGREFCHQYGVEELLRPLLEYDMGQDGVSVAGQGGVETPTKEQAMAAQRKRNMFSGGLENRPPAQSPNGTFFKNISNTAANAVNAINKARFDSPGPRPGSGNKRPNASRQPSLQMMGSQESVYPSSQQSMQSMHSDNSFGMNGQLEPAFGSQSTPYFTTKHGLDGSMDVQEPPRKRIRPSSSQDPFSQPTNGGYDVSMRETTPTEPNESFLYRQHGVQTHSIVETTAVGLQPLPQPATSGAFGKQQLLISLFLDSTQTDFAKHPAIQKLSGEDLDIPIDGTAHTALHWAATLARTNLLKVLIARGASIYRVNGGGETALMRASVTTNNHDQGSFSDLLELLGPTIELRDGRGRTVLHHLAVSSAVKGRSPACRYYLESLLEFVVRQGSAPSSQQNMFEGGQVAVHPVKSIGLARFMSDIVNAQDMSGDTALNVAARTGNKSIIQQLLEVGANPTIANRGGLKPVDFGVGGDPELGDLNPESMALATQEGSAATKAGESTRNLMTSITTLLSDTETSFRSEIQQKQSMLDQTHAKLREASSLLSEERRRLDELQKKADSQKQLKHQIANLRRANEEHKSLLRMADSKAGKNNAHLPADLKFGAADIGLEIDPALLPSTNPTLPLQMSPKSHMYLSSLPPLGLIRARISGYKANNAILTDQASQSKSRSIELEKKLKRVVCICTGCDEAKVDSMVNGLVVAVASEKGEDVEVGRVREFLRKVESVDA